MKRFGILFFIITTLITLQSCSKDPISPGSNENNVSTGNSSDSNYVDITFLGNDGVLLDDGKNRVIVDGLHRGGGGTFWSSLPPDKRVLLENSQAPFDSIDVAMITHNHSDHYSISAVGQHLTCNPSTQLLAITGVRNAMTTFFNYQSISSQIINNINPGNGQRAATNIAGVDIEVLNMLHFTNVCGQCGRNYAYIINMGGLKMLHLGDVDMLEQENISNFNLIADGIDVVFLPTPFSSFLTQQQKTALDSWINPGKIVALHIQGPLQSTIVAQVNSLYPGAVILTDPLQTHRLLSSEFGK